MKTNVRKTTLISMGAGMLCAVLHLLLGASSPTSTAGVVTFLVVFAIGCAVSMALLQLGVRLQRVVDEKCRARFTTAMEELSALRSQNTTLQADVQRMELERKHTQKLEALGRLAGGIAHDVNNVLASIMSIASNMKLDMESTDGRVMPDDVNDVLDACRRGRDLTLSLLGFARKGDFHKRPISLVKEIEDIRKLLLRVSPKSLSIHLQFESGIPQIEGDPSEIKNVLMNLFINGIDAMSGDGELTVSLRRKILDAPTDQLVAGTYVLLQVTDTGEGMSEETLRRAFEPFYTTKPEGKGTGLGLPRVWAIVKEHAGSVEIDSDSGIGTTFNVMFPALDEAREDPGIRGSRPPVKGQNRHTILLVDDEELIRKSARRIFEKIGYSVHVAENGQVALEIFLRHKKEIDLVVLDMIMPVMDGPATFAAIRGIRPEIPVIVCSGYSRDDAASELLRHDNVGFVQKPFSVGEITSRMSQILSIDA